MNLTISKRIKNLLVALGYIRLRIDWHLLKRLNCFLFAFFVYYNIRNERKYKQQPKNSNSSHIRIIRKLPTGIIWAQNAPFLFDRGLGPRCAAVKFLTAAPLISPVTKAQPIWIAASSFNMNRSLTLGQIRTNWRRIDWQEILIGFAMTV